MPAALAVQVIHKVAMSYLENTHRLHIFKERSLFLDGKLFSLKRIEKLAASIATLKGRLKAELEIGAYHRALLENPTHGARLILKRGEALIQIHIICEVPLREMIDPVGVDLGTKKLLVASNGFQISGCPLNAKRQHFQALKSSLREKGTSSSKRRLKQLVERENQWYKTALHQYSRALVKSLEEGDYLVMEKLQSTKVRSSSRKHKRCTRPSYQSLVINRLQQMISYKCADQGIAVIYVRPDFTSQRCPRCGTNDKSNRKSQALFRCIHCGYQHNEDFIASINLRELALGGWAAISQPDAVSSNHRYCKLLSSSTVMP
jgi:IS605 OrfB family transposase